MEYTEKEIKEYMGIKPCRNLGGDRFIKMCKNAGLIIELVGQYHNGGTAYKYKIIEDNMNLPNEIWIKCIYNNEYEVSNLGRVRNKFKTQIGANDGKGYVGCQINGKYLKVHRMVYFSFHPEEYVNE